MPGSQQRDRSIVLVAIATLAGCDRRAPIGSCSDPLDGEYDADGLRWAIRDTGTALEAYPVFDDSKVPLSPPATEVGPRVIELQRAGSGLAGEVHRRYLHLAEDCGAVAPAHVTACTGDTLELVLADPSPPLAFVPCTWGRAVPSHVERWRRR